MGQPAPEGERKMGNYDERCVFLPPDPRAEPYFRSLSQAVQDRIRAMDRYPATYQELMDAADRARAQL